MPELSNTALELLTKLRETASKADKILIGAGAGLSASAGLSYFNEEAFKTYFPEMYRLGYHCEYELVGRRDDEWSVGRKWAYWATHINYVRNIFPSAPLYKTLLTWLEGKDWFVVTSNADRQFYRAGFPMERVFEFQGHYDNMGCSKNCCGKTWNSLEPLARVLENIDHDTFECRPEGLPRCPYCGELADIVFRGENYRAERQRYIDFVDSSEDKKLCLIEFGVGFNTPGVIRWPFERITDAIANARLFRVNRGYLDYPGHEGYPEVPPELAGKACGIACDAADAINFLAEKK